MRKGTVYPEVQPGDIVLIKRKQYRGPFRYLLTRLILFFTTAWWRGEPLSKVYHAEMAVKQLSPDEFRVIDMEPPRCRYKDRSYSRKIIFRYNYRPMNFMTLFKMYVEAKRGIPYDFFKIVCFFLDFITMGTFFTRHFSSHNRDICSEFVARFYLGWVGQPCSGVEPNSTAPDDIHDYCLANPKLFDKIYED